MQRKQTSCSPSFGISGRYRRNSARFWISQLRAWRAWKSMVSPISTIVERSILSRLVIGCRSGSVNRSCSKTKRSSMEHPNKDANNDNSSTESVFPLSLFWTYRSLRWTMGAISFSQARPDSRLEILVHVLLQSTEWLTDIMIPPTSDNSILA